MLLLSLCAMQSAYADNWKLKDKEGVRYTLAELKGKWVLVNFWAPWCPPCLQELPDLLAFQQHHKNVQVIGVAVMYKSRKEVLDLVAKAAISYPIVLGNEDIAADFGGMQGMPTSFLYSPDGKLLGTHQGPLTQDEMELAITQSPASATVFIP